MTRQPINVAASIRARLLNGSRSRGEDFDLTLKRYAAERFLYRLGESSYRQHFVLKGAMLFPLWGGSIYRATRDLDFTAYGETDQDSLVRTIREICVEPCPEDGIEFFPESVKAEPIRDESDYGGYRVFVQAKLDSARITLQVDVGYANAVVPAAQEERYPVLVEGPPPPQIRAYRPESTVAEKLHTLVVRGATNSRMKDFYDLYCLGDVFTFSGDTLKEAIGATFDRRRTQVPAETPFGLSPAFFADAKRAEQWRRYLERNGLEGAPKNFDLVGETLRSFLTVPLTGLAQTQPVSDQWSSDTGWTTSAIAAEGGAEQLVIQHESRGADLDNRKETRPEVSLRHSGVEPVADARGRRHRCRPYLEYKDSGIEWLGRLPAHWDVRRLKTMATAQLSNVDKKSVEGEEAVRLCNYVDVYYNDLITDSIDFMHATATKDQVRRFSLKPSDVLITKDSETADDIAVPALVKKKLTGVISGYHLAHIRSDASMLDGAFLARSFAAEGLRDQFHVAANGITRFGITGDAIRCAVFARPPVDEQHAIAAFLDRETAKIDTLIAKKERLIELLQEKRTALITQAVTKGLDPNVPMKDSGVEWLGEVPEHWEVVRLRNVLRGIEQGWSPECENRIADHDEWGVLKSGCVNGGVFDENEHKALPEGIEPRGFLEVNPGDVLMSRASGSPTLIGSVAFVEQCRRQLMVSDKIFRLYAIPRLIRAQYVASVMGARPIRAQIEQAISGAGGLANNIGQQTVKNLWLPLPPLDEQDSLLDDCTRSWTNIEGLLAKVRQAVNLLKELRTALISAAVTGKIDVREEAA